MGGENSTPVRDGSGPHESHVTCAGRQARQHLRNCRMPDQQDLSPDPPAEYASDVEKNDPHRGCLRLARLRILSVHYGVYTNANFASAHEIGDPRVGDLLRFCDCTERKEQTRAECRANDPSHFHDGLLSMRRVSKTPFRQLPKNLTRAPSPDQSEGLT